MSVKTTELDTFFPLPSEAPSSRSPTRLPGITRASSEALVKTLKDDHVKWHAFFNDRGFHNHASHHLVAIYAMGAGGPLIEEAYQTHVVYMKPAFESPEPITAENFRKHLGKREFYNSYLEYFRALLLKEDVTYVIEEYLFSAKSNIGGPGIEGHPRMLNRFLAAIVHPMIHVGNGLELGLLGLVAEGLAQAAVHHDDGDTLIPPSLFEKETESATSAIDRLTALLPSLSLNKAPKPISTSGTKNTGVHAFTILARVLADQRFTPASLGLSSATMDPSLFERMNEQIGGAVVELTNEWIAGLEGEGATAEAIAQKIEEVAWMGALAYGVGGWAARESATTKKFNADFFYMHLVTSSLFLPTFAAYLSPQSTVLLLRSYFAVTLSWYIARGCAALPIRAFYDNVTAWPVPPGAPTKPVKDTLTPGDAAPNPWLPIVQTTIVHPAEHLCKTQRALMHNADLYGQRAAGDFAGLGLEGAEVLDGTLFIRIAGLTADRLGWMKEGQEAGEWDRVGFY
ncbi:hypothetical protein L226DRAFT_492010 [Lentinus tigrinus ALCF2SS1-7]|uniref:Oxidoreductase AflY n=1 Tax=Lentinus tigrinus ALCF2SS1-6 TaxID=1328759 RepID=A0A5C2S0K2_9APHY|nr:hypothetical protein L227DRAFT_552942 [Lentinus tigrinus ALCF2SS1-6]RPD71162.1 hypothetical protein L226DRAFT_492010 [Lentinus tigrinus ALCF2SS1-7]